MDNERDVMAGYKMEINMIEGQYHGFPPWGIVEKEKDYIIVTTILFPENGALLRKAIGVRNLSIEVKLRGIILDLQLR